MAPVPKPDHRRFYAAVAIAVVLAASSIAVWSRPKARTGPLEDKVQDGEVLDWCANGLTPIPGRGCFAEGGAGNDRALVVYLHGMYTPAEASQELERQARVARLATAKGLSVLALRGRQGQCTAESAKEHFCWPSNERNAADAAAVLAGWESSLAHVRTRIGQGRRYLLGFSNGGYFATLIATRALLPFDAVAIAGAGPVDTELPAPRDERPPLLLLAADEDPSVDSMIALDGVLKNASWPHATLSRDGGHQLTESDVAHALTFFERTRREPMPLTPPLSTRSPRPRPRLEAGAEETVGSAADTAPSAGPTAPPADSAETTSAPSATGEAPRGSSDTSPNE